MFLLHTYLCLVFRIRSPIVVAIGCAVSLIVPLNFKRVSDNFNLNKNTGCLNMSLKSPDDYWEYSYIYEKDKISQKLKQGFIDGIINASKYKRELKMSTHRWMINEVINSKEIQSKFNIEIIKNKKTTKISTEVLILFSKEEFEKNLDYAYKIATIERDSFNVVLKRK